MNAVRVETISQSSRTDHVVECSRSPVGHSWMNCASLFVSFTMRCVFRRLQSRNVNELESKPSVTCHEWITFWNTIIHFHRSIRQDTEPFLFFCFVFHLILSSSVRCCLGHRFPFELDALSKLCKNLQKKKIFISITLVQNSPISRVRPIVDIFSGGNGMFDRIASYRSNTEKLGHFFLFIYGNSFIIIQWKSVYGQTQDRLAKLVWGGGIR